LAVAAGNERGAGNTCPSTACIKSLNAPPLRSLSVAIKNIESTSLQQSRVFVGVGVAIKKWVWVWQFKSSWVWQFKTLQAPPRSKSCVRGCGVHFF